MINYIYRYEIIAAILSFAVIFTFFRKRKIKTHITTSYGTLMCLIMASSIIDVITVLYFNYGSRFPLWSNYLVNILYLTIYNAIPLSFYLCVYFTSENNEGLSGKQITIIAVPYLVSALFIITSPLTKFIFYIDSDFVYRHGPFFFLIAVISWTYVLFGWFVFLNRKKSFTSGQRHSFFVYTIVCFFCSIFQIIFPQYLITGFGLSLTGLIIFMTLENPEEYVDRDTRILNRKAFEILMKQNLEMKKDFGVVGIYMPEMRFLNDTIGATQKHNLQKDIVSQLRKFIPEDNLFRISHSKFAVVVPVDEKEREDIIGRIKTVFVSPFHSGDVKISLAAILDLVLCPQDADCYENLVDLVENSFYETSLYEEKGVITVNSDVLDKCIRERKLVQILTNAIAEEDFEVVYQPIYSVKDQAFTTAEALIRLSNRDLGYVSPEEFIPIAEKNGLILKIGNFVFKSVCKYLAQTRIWEHGIKYIHVNLSVLQCMQEKLYEQFFEIMDSYKLDYSLVNLEVTETTAIASSEILLDNMEKMKLHSMCFSLDDYGTGYSNTSTLVNYPFNTIKIDKSMLWAALKDEKAKIIFTETVSMIKELNMEVVVEGVETEEQVQFVTDCGCDYIQGYYYSFPLDADKFLEFINNSKANSNK